MTTSDSSSFWNVNGKAPAIPRHVEARSEGAKLLLAAYAFGIFECAQRLIHAGAENMKTFELFWSPEGRYIATVTARTYSAAIRKAPAP